jgi:hypothetical protein
VRYGDLFELLDEFGEEGVGDLGDDETKQSASARDERACLGVGEVVEIGDGLPHASSEDGVYGGDVIDGARDSRDRDTGKRRDAADVDLWRRGDVSRLARSFQDRRYPGFVQSAYSCEELDGELKIRIDDGPFPQVSYATENVYTRHYFG